MAINRDVVGRTYPPGEPYEVGREKIREFADAIGDPNPAYRDAAAAQALGHPDIMAPPTFPAVVSLRVSEQALSDPELNIGDGAVVHSKQRFSYTRSIYADDVLIGRLSIEDARTAGGNDLVSARVEVETSRGEHVCTAQATLVVRSGART